MNDGDIAYGLRIARKLMPDVFGELRCAQSYRGRRSFTLQIALRSADRLELLPRKPATSMFFVTSLVAISLALAGTVNGNQCSTAELLTIAGNSNLDGCTSEVGFGGFAAISALTEEQIKAVCDSTKCMALMEDMRAMDFGNCIIEGTNISLGTDILDPFAKVCSGSGSVDLSASSIDKEYVGSAASGASTNAIGWLSTFALTTTVLFM